MSNKKTKEQPLIRWAEKIDWKKRVKAVCKPCWEIKYCPFGPLVEDFPLKTESDERSCRIFGHDCPVFSTAEPFTETKELRNISRNIPKVTQFRVLKRENQICSVCGESVKDGEYEFDHIIPRAKGGSSDEYNVRMLCKQCNRKKGKKFEDEYLVTSTIEHIKEPVGIEIVPMFLELMNLAHGLSKEQGKFPDAVDFCKYDGRRKVREYDEFAQHIVSNISTFFNSKKPTEIKQKSFKALRYRWGFFDQNIHLLKDTAIKFNITENDIISEESSLLNRLGWRVKLTETTKKKWLRF